MFVHHLEFKPYQLANFKIETLEIHSEVLKGNPLGDPTSRHLPVLVPVDFQKNLPVVFILAGFTGNSPFYLNGKYNEKNAAQVLDEAFTDRHAPRAVYVFVDALTSWGGSQFLNSAAIGNYEDYLVQEVLPAVQSAFHTADHSSQRALMGGSSGGYGALHIGSQHPHLFGVIGAIAPDSFFEASLLPELYLALPVWEKYQQSGLQVLTALRQGSLKKQKNYHSLLNAFAMCACYLPAGHQGDFQFPLDPQTGLKRQAEWSRLIFKDPVVFLSERNFYRTRSKVYLDVGNKDQYHLHYGVRQISQQMKEAGFSHHSSEFDGNHFDIGERRTFFWKWLQEQWA